MLAPLLPFAIRYTVAVGVLVLRVREVLVNLLEVGQPIAIGVRVPLHHAHLGGDEARKTESTAKT